MTTSDGPCVHHWVIDDLGLGACKFCNEVKQFTPTSDMSMREYTKRGYAFVNNIQKLTVAYDNDKDE